MDIPHGNSPVVNYQGWICINLETLDGQDKRLFLYSSGNARGEYLYSIQ